MSLVARHLEANGIPTVILGSARDIIDHCGVPRFLFTDFPLGNPCGRPWDREMQREIVAMGLDLLESADAPRSVAQTPFRWGEGADDQVWRRGYLQLDPARREELRKAGERRRTSQQSAKRNGTARSD
ncbi:MAG: hypothetical protein VX466_13295 [Myxococcota bacterium]|nr:hypothetical protein [Myxococcota bacterium]